MATQKSIRYINKKNREKIDYDDVIDEVMGNATESPFQTFDLGKKWEDFEYITKFGYWDNISTIVWEFDVEDFDINKLTFHYECFDAIFELADYNVEEDCINLLYDGKKIEVSDSGSSDGDFEECWNLDDDDNNESPQERRTISQNDFKDCKDLTEITIPNSVTEIGESAFEGCTGLTEINIPSSVKNIGTDAFRGCESLETITFGAGINKISNDAFYSYDALKAIYVPAKKTDYYKKRLLEKLHSLIVELAPVKNAKSKNK